MRHLYSVASSKKTVNGQKAKFQQNGGQTDRQNPRNVENVGLSNTFLFEKLAVYSNICLAYALENSNKQRQRNFLPSTINF